MKRKFPYYIKVAYQLTLKLNSTLADDVDIINLQILLILGGIIHNLLQGLV